MLGLVLPQMKVLKDRVIEPNCQPSEAKAVSLPEQLQKEFLTAATAGWWDAAASFELGHKFEDFVREARQLTASCSILEQRQYGSKLLRRVLPTPLCWMVRSVLGCLGDWPEARTAVASFGIRMLAPVVGYWLVGESRLLEPAEEAVACSDWHAANPQDSGGSAANTTQGPILLIRKCKFLEAVGGCKGACLNLCKGATEEFLSNELGLPVYMDPNLEDFSCRMMFFQQPLPPEKDPAFQKPCKKLGQCDGRFSMPEPLSS